MDVLITTPLYPNHTTLYPKRHVAHILKRAGVGESSKGETAWLTNITLVGHDQRVTTTRFAPAIFQPKPKPDGELGGWVDGVVRCATSLVRNRVESNGPLINWPYASYLQGWAARGRPIRSLPRGTRGRVL